MDDVKAKCKNPGCGTVFTWGKDRYCDFKCEEIDKLKGKIIELERRAHHDHNSHSKPR